MNEKKYNVLDSTLQKITSDVIRLSYKDKKDYNDHLGKVLECIVNQMKKNEVFKILYRNNVYTGSFYENLRISKPDEFDINLIFVLPAALKIIYNQKQPGFVKIKINSLDEVQVKKHNVPSLERVLKSWIDPKTGFLLRTGFMQWMQGVFTQAMDAISLQNTMIKRSASGPAFTVKVSQPQLGLSEYSVDLVPVFEFPEKDLPSTSVRKLPKGALHKEWTVVPKAPPNVVDSTYWRMSFYKQEKEIMNNLNGMKHIIKLIKLFRDKENWKVLSSYAIKTVFLWECERQPKEGFWQNGVGQLFVHMLRRLSEHMTKQSIPFYWDKNLNLLSQVKNDTLKIMSNRIIVVLRKIDSHLEDNPQFIKNILGCTETDIQEDNGHKSNTDCDLLIELNDQQTESIKTSARATSPVVPRIQHSFSLSETREKGISPTDVINNLDKYGLPKKKSEEKIGVAVQLRIGSKSGEMYQTNTNSDSIVDIISVILKEQQNIKQSLQSLTQEHVEIKKEIRELREENAQLRKHLHMHASTSQASTVHGFLDLQPSKQNCHLSRSPLLIPEQKNSTAMNTTGKNILESDTITCNSYMSELIDVFTA